MCKKRIAVFALAALTAIVAVQSATAQSFIYNGEIAISGATLFRDFFKFPASTNDYIDADGDGIAGKFNSWPPDQLAVTYVPGSPLTTHWIVQYRGVGSVNGLSEFLASQGCGTVATRIPDPGYFNRFLYAQAGGYNWTGPYADASGTPKTPDQIDLAVLDVPTDWAVLTAGGTPAWNLKPGMPGSPSLFSRTAARGSVRSRPAKCSICTSPAECPTARTSSRALVMPALVRATA